MASSPSTSVGYLHALCRQGNTTTIRSYLQANINKLEDRVGFLGYTPLHEATNQGQTSVVRLLLLYGANANAKANGFYTPLHIAASLDNTDCVVELVKHNADITNKDEFGKTPYETAMIHKCKKSARVLRTEEVKKAARENDKNLRDMLTSIQLPDVMPSCFKEALMEASSGGHMEAICSLIITGGRHSLLLRNCIREALRFHFCEAAAMLMTCYAAKHDKRKLLKYLMSMEMSREEEREALSELPQEGVTRDAMDRIRSFISEEKFRVAVPIGLALQQRRKDAVGIILMSTNCSKHIKQIDWAKLALGEIDPLWLENVTWVEKFFLASNLLVSVPANIHTLSKLCVLDLRRNHLRSVPARLLQLPNLRDLRLSENKIMELPKKCKWSSSLKTLNLSDNLLETLPKSMAQAKLSILFLARNNLYEVPLCVCQITTLQSLDLSGNPRLTQLPYDMGRLRNIEFLKLERLDQMTDPPEEIKQDGVKTIMYLRNSLRSSKGYYTVKLMLVGRAAQGKTTLMHRLMKDYCYNTNESTNGIAMDEFRYNRNAFGLFSNYPEYIFQVWDFGGQEDFYTTHQCFLSTLALYLLVWKLEEGESGIEMLKSWLDTISATASNTSLIIVGTHLDKVRRCKEAGFPERMRQQVMELVEMPKYKGQLNVVHVTEVSCALDNREGIDDLRNVIYDAASVLKKTGLAQVSVMGEMIPHSFWLVADAIQAKRQELRNTGETPIMHKSEYEALVLDIIKNDTMDIEDANDLRDVTQFMHERGILLHYDDPNQDLQDLYFIDPKWLCELMARVVTLPQANPYIFNGILDLSNLPMLLRGEQFAHHNSPQFIRLLNRFQIACSLDDNRVLIPSKLPAEKPEEARNDDLPFITLKRIHSLPCIPHGFWSRLISRLLFYMKDMLAGGENVTRKECLSPFQLDPFCCHCPLVLENLTLVVESDPQLLGATEASMAGSFENLVDPSQEFQGFRYYGTPRQGTFINGRFFRLSDSEGRSSRSDSGYEYSSDDDDEARGVSHQPLNSSFPLRQSRGHPWTTKGVFRHGTDPGVRREDKVSEPEDDGTSCSPSAFPVMAHDFQQDVLSGTVLFDPSPTRLGDASCVTMITSEQEGLDGKHGSSSLPGSESQRLNFTGEIAVMQDLSIRTEPLVSTDTEGVVGDGGVINELLLTCSDHMNLESCPERINGSSVDTACQDCSSGDGSRAPCQSTTFGSCTSNPTTGCYIPDSTSGSCTPDPSSGAYTPNLTSEAYTLDPTTVCYIPDPTSGSYTPDPTSGSYTPDPTSGSYIPDPTSRAYTPNPTSGAYAPDPTSGSYIPDPTSGPYAPDSTSGSYTPDSFIRELTDGCYPDMGVSLAKPSGDGEGSLPVEDLNADGLPQFPRENAFFASSLTPGSSPSISIPSDKESSGETRQVTETQRSSSSETEDTIVQRQGPCDPKENKADGGHTLDITDPGDRESLLRNTPSTSYQSDEPIPTISEDSKQGRSSRTASATSACNPSDSKRKSQTGSPHLPRCPFIEDFPVERLPLLPTDVASLIDHGFLHCWKSGVCLRHPRLFLLLYCAPDPEDADRQLVITEVSPCPQGRRVLSYVVDHIDTLIREWYQELSTTDGLQPKVRQLIPCVVCERLGLEPHKFTFTECQLQSSKADTICCPKHPRLQVNLHKVAPDIMLHDVDADLVLSHDELTYEDTDSNRLGTGGFGKVIRGKCRGRAVAIKFYIQSDESEPLRHYREVRKELNVLRRVRKHPFLISVIGVSLRPLCLVLELAERGALTEILLQPKTSINRIVLFRIAYQVADALRFLHDLGVIYRDLKPENVLVWSLNETDDLHVKLIDFGTANFATSTGLVCVAGTPGIHAPEMLECANKEEYTAQVDVYSYAILLYKLITRLEPFEEYDSSPKVNAAVTRGERPKWQHVPVATFGLPTLTELMLRCWSAKPTRRPTTAEIAEQVLQPAFQCLLAKQPIPTQQLSVRHVCYVPDTCDLWLACDGHSGNKIFIYDGRSLDMKFSFSIDTYQDQSYSFQIQCMHYMTPHVLIAVRGAFDLINVYTSSNASRYKCVTSIPSSEQVTCVTSNDEYIFVGLNDAKVRRILKTDMKKSDKKRGLRCLTVGRHRILSMTVVQDKLWVSTSRYIFRYFTKPGEMEAFDIDAMWYGGPEGMENNPQTQISLLRASFDQRSVLSVCRSVLSKWDVNSIQNHLNIDCAEILQSLTANSREMLFKESSDAIACINCVEPTRDAIWLGTASGHILIFDAVAAELLTWFHPFDETRSLTLIEGPGPCGTEHNFVVSTGKGLRPEGLGTQGVCVLSAERVREPLNEISTRKFSEPKGKALIGRKLRSPTPPLDEPDAAETSWSPPPKCAMIMWQAVSKTCFARIEAKSGRQRFPIGSTNRGTGVEPSSRNGVQDNPQTE